VTVQHSDSASLVNKELVRHVHYELFINKTQFKTLQTGVANRIYINNVYSFKPSQAQNNSFAK